MLYFSKLRIFTVIIFTLIFSYFALSNFIKLDDEFFKQKINLGLDLKGGSYLLLEIDNTPVIEEKLQNKVFELKKYFKEKSIVVTNFFIEDQNIKFDSPNDFDKVPIVDNSCYLIKPRQVHLVKREEEADGFLIQFFNTSIFSEEVSSLLTLQYHSDIKVIFENDKLLINKGISFLNLIRNITKEESVFLKQKSIHLLSTLLYELEECTIKKGKFKNTNDRSLIKFTELVNLNLNTKTVNEYAEKLNITSKKLTDIVKNKYGITPLKFIHNAVLLEIKRDLMFKDTNLKEISYNYNFDSPSNFSLFVKKNTGLSPTDLQKELLDFTSSRKFRNKDDWKFFSNIDKQ